MLVTLVERMELYVCWSSHAVSFRSSQFLTNLSVMHSEVVQTMNNIHMMVVTSAQSIAFYKVSGMVPHHTSTLMAMKGARSGDAQV